MPQRHSPGGSTLQCAHIFTIANVDTAKKISVARMSCLLALLGAYCPPRLLAGGYCYWARKTWVCPSAGLSFRPPVRSSVLRYGPTYIKREDQNVPWRPLYCGLPRYIFKRLTLR